jgi:hypothetical protein
MSIIYKFAVILILVIGPLQAFSSECRGRSNVNCSVPKNKSIFIKKGSYATVYLRGFWQKLQPIVIRCQSKTNVTVKLNNFSVTKNVFKYIRGGVNASVFEVKGCKTVIYEGSVRLRLNHTIIAY